MAISLVSLNHKSQALLNLKYSNGTYNASMSIGARIRQLRQHFKYSQEKFGELCGGVTKGMVSQWESDIVVPPYDRLRDFKNNGHEFSYDWLYEGNIPFTYEKSPEAQMFKAMQKMNPADKYKAVKICNTLAEPADGGGGGPNGDSPKIATQ